jgi:hypothetical protein
VANQLLTINMVTREAVRLWKNSNAFLQSIDTQYDDQYARTGAKIGMSLRIRLPNDYIVRTGPAIQTQGTTEPSISLVVATQKGVDIDFNSAERTMSLDDYSSRVLAPAINNLAGNIAADIMGGVEGGICNFIANVDGGGNILSPTAATWLTAGAILDANSAPMADRKVVNDPFSDARTVATLAGLFNPTPRISEQYNTGAMRDALGYLWMRDQTVIKHRNGSFTAGTVNGANQTGTTLLVNPITGSLNQGDIITIAGVNAVNRITKVTTGQPRQFVVTAPAPSGSTSINIFPALVPGTQNYNPDTGNGAQQYQTVDFSPANAAPIALTSLPNAVYRKNFLFAPEAVTMAAADLELPTGSVSEAYRESFDNISIRMVTGYLLGTDVTVTRMDVLYGYVWVRPEWAVVVADSI